MFGGLGVGGASGTSGNVFVDVEWESLWGQNSFEVVQSEISQTSDNMNTRLNNDIQPFNLNAITSIILNVTIIKSYLEQHIK